MRLSFILTVDLSAWLTAPQLWVLGRLIGCSVNVTPLKWTLGRGWFPKMNRLRWAGSAGQTDCMFHRSWPARSRTPSSPRPAFKLTNLHKHPALSTCFPHRPPGHAHRPPEHAHRPPEHADRPPEHANALSAALLQRGSVHPKHTPLPQFVKSSNRL